MIRITYIEFNGTRHMADVAVGDSLMQGAVGNMIPGIDGDCGGACACATCLVYVDPEWADQLEAPTEMEKAALEFAKNVQSNSRLACQIRAADELNGLTVRMPGSQR